MPSSTRPSLKAARRYGGGDEQGGREPPHRQRGRAGAPGRLRARRGRRARPDRVSGRPGGPGAGRRHPWSNHRRAVRRGRRQPGHRPDRGRRPPQGPRLAADLRHRPGRLPGRQVGAGRDLPAPSRPPLCGQRPARGERPVRPGGQRRADGHRGDPRYGGFTWERHRRQPGGAPMTTTPSPTDFLALDRLLSDEERLIRDTVRSFVSDKILPEIASWFERGELPRELAKELGALGLLGMHLEGYGCAGTNAVSYGLACLELEAGDSGMRSFASVQGSLSLFPIWRYGSEEQKRQWLPRMA